MAASTTVTTEQMGVKTPTSASDPSGQTGGDGFFLSVGAKGVLVFVALIAYLTGIAMFAIHQKDLLFRDFENIQEAISDEAILAQAHVSIFHAIGALTVNMNDADPEAGMRRIQMHQNLYHTRQSEVTARFPLRASNAGHVKAAFEAANRDASQENLKLLVTELLESESELERLTEETREKRKSLSLQYRTRSDAAALTVIVLGALGLLLLAAAVGFFFRRLVHDLRVLQNAALATVRGIRSQPMVVSRHDEVGQLMMAVNSMADTLDQSAKELMLERQKYFHQEKMAAIGALAAGISHEIGNPIAAISGITQEMIDRRALGEIACNAMGCGPCRPELIHAQTIRLAAITREISVFASPGTAEPQLLDLNGQLRNTVSLIRYDKRLGQSKLQLELDSQLPAIHGVSDQLTQLTMNLLINAMDALESVGERTPSIVVKTGANEQHVWMLVSDNGCGMTESTLNRVFEAFFTTKAAGKGTGLGLSLCYSIAKAHGGFIEIESTPTIGTHVKVFFPLHLATNTINYSI